MSVSESGEQAAARSRSERLGVLGRDPRPQRSGGLPHHPLHPERRPGAKILIRKVIEDNNNPVVNARRGNSIKHPANLGASLTQEHSKGSIAMQRSSTLSALQARSFLRHFDRECEKRRQRARTATWKGPCAQRKPRARRRPSASRTPSAGRATRTSRAAAKPRRHHETCET